ncbi:hypothetical protein BJ875DRAFT_445728 [Amylocarpus encephaloides]|uniref:Uncharacterized protein n=1 Tax=Amylocarpus encephaloides TaxID=45428 RepID=A0A9P8C0R7_9HELO|nr:hypothetical protein BJ875DRAFT_445728 [Amylocarpus encephaloides]
MVKEDWFIGSLKTTDPIDAFVIIRHNPARLSDTVGTFGLFYNAIRQASPDAHVQIPGGRTHIRDSTVGDEKITSIELGRYLGWLSLSGFDSSSYNGVPLAVSLPLKNLVLVQLSCTFVPWLLFLGDELRHYQHSALFSGNQSRALSLLLLLEELHDIGLAMYRGDLSHPRSRCI